MKEHKVKIRLEGKDDASDDVKKVQGSLGKLGNFVKTNLAASMISITALFYGFTRALKAVIGASAEQELAVKKLDAALSPLGDKAGAVSKELQEYAAALQQVTSYGDETIIAGQALIASFTKNTEEIKGATKAALDLAAATGQSLQSAFLLLGRAAAGETSMLSRYGITLDESTPKAEKFAAALVKIGEQFGGQAQAQAETFTGQMSQLSNAFGDLQEAIGDSITQNEKATSSLGSLKDGIEALIPLANRAGVIFSFMGEVLWKLVTPLRAVADVTKAVTDAWLKLSGATDVVEGNTEALEVTAKRLGITVDELKIRLEQARIAMSDLNEDAGKLDDTFAADAIEINNLVGSLRKMEEMADEVAPAVEGVGDAVSDAGGAASVATGTLDGLATALEEDATAAENLRDALSRARTEIEATNRAAITMTGQFDKMADAAGRASAIAAAIEGGGQLVLGGTRIRLSGGGSRLTSTPGLGGRMFNPERRSYVRPDGSVVFL